MKKTTLSVLSCVALAATSFAGTSMVSSKEMKQPVAPGTCFNDNELQADVFGAYGVTEAGQGGALTGNHGWGGGVGVNYFFHRYFGLGAEGYWLDSKSALQAAAGSLILRYPCDVHCVAPYLMVGGGGNWDGHAFGSAHWGGGIEYRVIPHKLGMFLDGRFVWENTRNDGVGNPHYTLVRAGVRWVF